jgi:nonsense-mediated mRNA decay protein 3
MNGIEGGGDGILHTRTHLGGILQPGDTALGYFLTRANYNSEDFAELLRAGSAASRVPDIVLVKKAYPNRRKKGKARGWKLKSIAKEVEDDSGGRGGVIGRMGGRDQKKVEDDYEIFLRDLEEDTEMRAAVNLYKAPPGSSTSGKRGKGKKNQFAMDVDDSAGAANAPPANGGPDMDMEDEGEEETDFPEVNLDELLEDMAELGLEDHVEEE